MCHYPMGDFGLETIRYLKDLGRKSEEQGMGQFDRDKIKTKHPSIFIQPPSKT